MAPALVLYQPDIAQNTGTLIRLAACTSTQLHIIHPTGFVFSAPKLRRAGMDYIDHADLIEHDSYARFEQWRLGTERRLILLTTKSSASVYDITFRSDDLIMLGRETAGVPEDVAASTDLQARIPMATGLRSLNVAVSGAMALGEALRQTGTWPQEGASALSIM